MRTETARIICVKSMKNISVRDPFFRCFKTQIPQIEALKECKLRYRNHAVPKSIRNCAKRKTCDFRMRIVSTERSTPGGRLGYRVKVGSLVRFFSCPAGSNRPAWSPDPSGFVDIPNPAPYESEILIVKRFSSHRGERCSWAHNRDGSRGSSASIQAVKAIPVSSRGDAAAPVPRQSVEEDAEWVWEASEGVLEPLFLQASCAENVAKSAISIPSSRTMSEFT
jgi:hypothetical protein